MSQCEWHPHALMSPALCPSSPHPCASPPASCLAAQNNKTSPFSLPTPKLRKNGGFRSNYNENCSFFLIHKGSLKVAALRINTGLRLEKTFTLEHLVTRGFTLTFSILSGPTKNPKKEPQNNLQFSFFTAMKPKHSERLGIFLSNTTLDSFQIPQRFIPCPLQFAKAHGFLWSSPRWEEWGARKWEQPEPRFCYETRAAAPEDTHTTQQRWFFIFFPSLVMQHRISPLPHHTPRAALQMSSGSCSNTPWDTQQSPECQKWSTFNRHFPLVFN